MTEITHQKARSLMFTAQADLAAEDRQALDQHLETCGECLAYRRSLEQTQHSLRRSLHRRWDPARARISIQQIQNASRRKHMFKRLTLTAGSLVVIVIVALVARGLAGSSPTQDSLPTAGQAAGRPTQAAATLTVTPTPAPSQTPAPTASVLPPHDYTVTASDTCASIALTFGVSVQSLILLNDLSANCVLNTGQIIKIPYPTPTPGAPATSTSGRTFPADCVSVDHTVQPGDTLASIAAYYAVPAANIRDYNGLASDTVNLGAVLRIPLCRRAGTDPTAVITPPALPAPELLLPADGTTFSPANDRIVLTWNSVGIMDESEAYQVIIVDVASASGSKHIDYTSTTNYTVPANLHPQDGQAHIFQWWITATRFGPLDNTNRGMSGWMPAGPSSVQREFVWQNSVVLPEATATRCAPGNASGPNGFAWPIPEHYLSGLDFTTAHPGLDLAGKAGEDVHAAAAGTVIFAGVMDGGLGNAIIIDHGGWMSSLYAHLDALRVACGANVTSGQVIATFGQSGSAARPMLYFEILYKDIPQNPWNNLPPP